METLTLAEYHEQHLESREEWEEAQNVNGFDWTVKGRDRFYAGTFQLAHLRPGLQLVIDNGKCLSDLSRESDHVGYDTVVSRFQLAGSFRTITLKGQSPYVSADYLESAGESIMHWLPDIEEIEQFVQGSRDVQVAIRLSRDYFRTFCVGLNILPERLRALLNRDSPPRFHQSVGKFTPAIQVVLHQLVHSPYQGTIQRVYLEAKVLELLALQLQQWTEGEQKLHTISNLKPREVEQIYQARDIVIANYIEPPTVLDLAEQVDLYHMTLKQGFKELFGTTVFGYLHRYRMDHARYLLLNGKLSVATVANAVGYANPSHFAAAFKRRFGMNPSACLAGKPGG